MKELSYLTQCANKDFVLGLKPCTWRCK